MLYQDLIYWNKSLFKEFQFLFILNVNFQLFNILLKYNLLFIILINLFDLYYHLSFINNFIALNPLILINFISNLKFNLIILLLIYPFQKQILTKLFLINLIIDYY